jgi:cell volume regulation protein A
LLLGTALAPTDPAVVFSVLGRREVAGRSGTILEGESGANDPVGIALLASLLAAGPAAGLAAAGSIAAAFLLQLAVGAAVGVAGGVLLVGFMRRVPLPSKGLYPLRVLAGALVIYGAATLAHGSGFLAVFVAASWPATPAPPTRGRSNDSTVPWPAWPRSWRLWSWACKPCLTVAPWGWVWSWPCC